MRIAIAADHAGAPLRGVVSEAVRAAGHEPWVIGEPLPGDDYPDVARAVAEAIQQGEAVRGVVLCGSGAGVTVAANKVPLVRAAPANEPYTARQMVEHDHVNVLALGARVIGSALATEIVYAFATATFSGEDRHVRRLGKVLDIEASRVQGVALALRAGGQSLWVDGVASREISEGKLARWVGDLGVTGVRLDPAAMERELRETTTHDNAIGAHKAAGIADPEDLAFALLLADLIAAADMLRVIYDASRGEDGYASIGVPPWQIDTAHATEELARRLRVVAGRPNIMVGVPATDVGLAATRRLVAEGAGVNVTSVFSADHYRAAVQAYIDGLEQRIARGDDPTVGSIVSLPVARWRETSAGRLPEQLRDTVGVAVASEIYAEFRALLDSDQWKRLADAGAPPQRLLFATAPDSQTALPTRLAAPGTTLAVGQETLTEFVEQAVGQDLVETGTAALERVRAAGIDLKALATELQAGCVEASTAAWSALLERVATKAGLALA